MIAQAQSGTGKTATFSIAILQQLEIEQQEVQALVLAPTRELAQQVWQAYHWVKPQACWAKHASADDGVRWSIFYIVYNYFNG